MDYNNKCNFHKKIIEPRYCKEKKCSFSWKSIYNEVRKYCLNCVNFLSLVARNYV